MKGKGKNENGGKMMPKKDMMMSEKEMKEMMKKKMGNTKATGEWAGHHSPAKPL